MISRTSLTLIALATTADLLPAQTPTAIVLSGSAAPAGGNYSAFGNPVLNGSGRVAFTASLTGGSSTSGIFAGSPGSLQSVALQGTAAPGVGFYDSFGTPVLNGSGQVAFNAVLVGGSSGGIFAGTAGSLQAIAVIGTSAPAGGSYSGLEKVALNDSGQVAFQATLTGGTPTAGIFAGAAGSVQAVALQGTAAPAGGNYSSGIGVLSSVVNGSGQVTFHSELTGGTSTAGIFLGSPGSVQAVALQGAAAPTGGNYSFFSITPVLNNSGTVAFRTFLTGGTATAGIFAGQTGSLQTVALQGSAAPAGGNYNSFGNPVLNGSGQIAFTANLTGGTATDGLFVGTSGSLQAAALQGTAAPAGDTYSAFSNVGLNGSGQVAFTATLTGTGVTAATDSGLFAGLPGALVQVVREGDVIDVDAGAGVDFRTVDDGGIAFQSFSGGQDGRSTSFADTGLIAYRLTFTDGTSGVFTSSITPVPEPGLVFGLAAVAVSFVTGRCPRRS